MNDKGDPLADLFDPGLCFIHLHHSHGNKKQKRALTLTLISTPAED